tara:strand:- start:441 stop:2246 length:1806 start_codon:yes stop_codon:yes gene_type:complete
MNYIKKITDDFNKGNYRENFKDLIKIYKENKTSDIANKLGVVLINLNKPKFAIYFFEKSINYNSKNYKPYFNLANILKRSNYKSANKYIDIALSIQNTNEAKIIKSHLLINEYKYYEAVKLLNDIKSSESYYLLGSCHLALGNDLESKTNFEKSLEYKNININFLHLNTFPRVYKNTRQLNYFRNKFNILINNINNLLLSKNLSQNERLNIIKSKTNFHLAYQQKNDLDLNKKYYDLISRIYHHDKKLNKSNFKKNKILFVSGFFYKHTVSKIFFKFVEEFVNIKKFEVHMLSLSNVEDDWTTLFKKLNGKFYSKTSINEIFNFLLAEKFETIIFLDHAMNNLTQAILNNKLAKKYFMLWGHPVTTGSKNVDFFISSKLMDNNNQSNYSEKLVLLDGIGFNYKFDKNLESVRKITPKNNSFYIPQALFKFLPKYDHLLGLLLEQNKNSTISIIKDKDPYYSKIFIERLLKNKKINKNFNKIIFINGQDKKFNFIDKLMEHKIIMDTIGWSGGNTSIEALYLNKPIITLKGSNLRGNHTAAFLRQMDLEILIAKSYSEYLSIAKKLNDDENFYSFVVDKIKENKKFLFEKKISLFNKIDQFI